MLLDAHGQHAWSPIAPCGRVEVALTAPRVRWTGNAYLDSNTGKAPLENAFVGWHWSRAELSDGTIVLYDVQRRDGTELTLALHFDRRGQMFAFPVPTKLELPPSRWRISRTTRSDDQQASIARTLLDSPFYARSLVSSRFQGQQLTAVHESLSLDRFRNPWVQAMLRFRIPRSLD